MEIQCPSCNFSAEVPDERVPDGGTTATCPTCKTKFNVYKEADFLFNSEPVSPQMKCPKCGEGQSISNTCIKCGLIFSKFISEQTANAKTGTPVEQENAEVEKQALEKTQVPSKNLSIVKRWGFGIFFIFISLITYDISRVQGETNYSFTIFFIIWALICVLPARDYVYRGYGLVNIRKDLVVIILFIICLITYNVFESPNNEKISKKRSEKYEAEKKNIEDKRQETINAKNAAHFNANSQKVIADVKTALNSSEPRKALSITSRYITSGNSELQQLHNEAKGKTAQLDAREKADRDRANAITDLAIERRQKVKLQFSSWDGSHGKLVDYIKNRMNNPKSFEHVDTKYTVFDDSMYVYMTYRGTNAFNAIVTTKLVAEVSLNGEVLKIISDE